MFFASVFGQLDHVAVAVDDLESAIDYYAKKFDFKLDVVRDTHGKYTGMRSAVLFSGEFSVVLIKSLTPGSQVEKYINKYGTGVQHMAFRVDDLENVSRQLESRGVQFSTSILQAAGLKQIFTKRDPNTGMMHEFIERTNQTNFDEKNINQLFEQLEEAGEY